MFSRILFVCLSVALFSGGSSLSCRWMQHKSSDHSEEYLRLLDNMVNNSTNTTGDAGGDNALPFPQDLYDQASSASAEDKVVFMAQVMDEVAAVFEEDYSNASWEEKTVKDFLEVVTQQADGLRSCIGRHSHKKRSKKLHMSFKRLTGHLEAAGHSAESWELIRQKVRNHLVGADQLIASLLN